jgi:hypothetical protein
MSKIERHNPVGRHFHVKAYDAYHRSQPHQENLLCDEEL